MICVAGFQPSAAQQASVAAYVKEAGPALLELRLFPNLDTTASADAGDLPTGMLAVMDPAARVNVSLISDQLFEGLAGVRVATTGLKEKALIKAAPALQEAAFQAPKQAFAGDVRSVKNNKDTRQWAPQLGGPGSFVGVYSQLQDDHRSKQFWIMARSTVPGYVRDLKQALVKAPTTTYRDLVQGDEWKRRLSFGADGANRNLGRLLANAAEAMAVEVPRRDEICAFLVDANHLAPETAVPDVTQHTHTIQSVAWHGKPAVALAYGVVPADECFGSRFYVVANPYDGIIAFPISDYGSVTTAMALPADTGRKTAPAALAVGDAHYEGRTAGVVWEQSAKEKSDVHPDLHRDAFHAAHVDGAFRRGMTQLGWKMADREERLVPVALKLWKQ